MNANVNVEPKKDIGYLNGVSTADMVLLQKHILGIDDLNSPYKLIAADVNSDEKVNTRDMLHISRLILGITDEFQDSESWKFVPQDYIFSNPLSPWGYPQTMDFDQFLGEERADFIGVKIGDISGNAKPNTLIREQALPTAFLTLQIENNAVEVSSDNIIEIRGKSIKDITGFQFTLSVADELEILEVIPGSLPKMSMGNFGMQALENGTITVAWANEDEVSLTEDDILFSLKVSSETKARISELLSIHSGITPAEAYDKEVQPMGIKTDFILDDPSAFILYQNSPNPFSHETTIGFELPESDNISLTFRDVAGRVVYQMSKDCPKGYNVVDLEAAVLRNRGVLYYELTTSFGSKVKKMIVLE